MKKVHRIYHWDMHDFTQSIVKGDYTFYDQYDNCREILIVGSSNAGKSALLNALNAEKNDISKSSKVLGKTQTLDFFLVGTE